MDRACFAMGMVARERSLRGGERTRTYASVGEDLVEVGLFGDVDSFTN